MMPLTVARKELEDKIELAVMEYFNETSIRLKSIQLESSIFCRGNVNQLLVNCVSLEEER